MVEQNDQLTRLLTPAHEVPEELCEARFYEVKRFYVENFLKSGPPPADPAKSETENAAAVLEWETLSQKLCEIQCALIMRWRRVIVAPTKRAAKRKKPESPPIDLDRYLDSLNEVG